MKKIFNNVSFDVIEKFSPELMLAVESCIEEGREDLDAMLESNSRFSLMMPSALAIGALEGRFMPPCREAGLTPYSSVPEKFGSLGAYAIAQAGNANACAVGAGEFFEVQIHRDLDREFERSV